MKQVSSIVLLVLVFCGCAKEPQIITETVYQEVRTPVACIEKMPEKPKFEANDPQSAQGLMEYFKTCEELLKGCVDDRVGD
jgi:PBP1b-binding outer membrane lipoprotein LpoB